MPGLLDIRPNFLELTQEEREEFLRAYRKRRADDLKKPATYGAAATQQRNTRTKYQQLGLSPEEIELCKTLGLKPKDIIALKKQVTENNDGSEPE